jgi:hypothetical protein
MQKIKVRRVSQMKNKFGSFAYAIVDAMGLDISGLSGIYANESGEPFVYSQNLIGSFQKDTIITAVVRVKNGRSFLNLTNDIPQWVDQVQTNMDFATRLGFGGEFRNNVAAQLAGSINFGGRQAAQAVQAPAAVTPPAEIEQPVDAVVPEQEEVELD